jgi:hypothetical protein
MKYTSWHRYLWGILLTNSLGEKSLMGGRLSSVRVIGVYRLVRRVGRGCSRVIERLSWRVHRSSCYPDGNPLRSNALAVRVRPHDPLLADAMAAFAIHGGGS